MKLYKLRNILIAASFSALAACGGSDSGGGTAGASIDADNQDELATAATEAVKSGANGSSSNIFAAQVPNRQPAREITVMIAQAGPQSAEVAGVCDSGSLDQTGSDNTGALTFNNCDIGTVVFNGTVTYTTSTSGSTTTFALTYNNFTVTYNGETTSINMSATCTTSNSSTSCTYDSTTTGFDGRTYTITNLTVSGNDATGWTVSATVIDPDFGQVTISTTSAVTLNCPNGQPDSGSITVSDGASSMTVTYNDCNSYSVTFNGSTTTYNW